MTSIHVGVLGAQPGTVRRVWVVPTAALSVWAVVRAERADSLAGEHANASAKEAGDAVVLFHARVADTTISSTPTLGHPQV